MFCDDCAVEPAIIDHLDLTQGQVHLRRLCGRCAEVERTRWNDERLQPMGSPASSPSERRAA